mgnify:CR=1 FL=1|jgi:hypothetical protein
MVSDSLFKEQMRELRHEAYEAIMVSDTTIDYDFDDFNLFFDMVENAIDYDRQRGFIADTYGYYNELEPESWRSTMKAWLEKNTQSLVNENDKEPQPNEELLTAFQAQINDALLKDSQNRADIVLDFLQEKGDDLMASFGVEATDLIFEIVGGLKQDEEQRLGKPKTISTPVQVVEQTDEEVIDELDFLDEDIDEVFNLEELEEELDLDDLNLD